MPSNRLNRKRCSTGRCGRGRPRSILRMQRTIYYHPDGGEDAEDAVITYSLSITHSFWSRRPLGSVGVLTHGNLRNNERC